jgi:hypothetical protein
MSSGAHKKRNMNAGLGDIIPITDGGRILVCVWSFFGTALWLVLLTSIVSFLCDFVYVEVILNAYWYLHIRRLQAQKKAAAAAATADNSTPDLGAAGASTTTTSTHADQARADEARAIGGTTNDDDADEDDDDDSDIDSEDEDDDDDDHDDDVEKQEKTKTKEEVGEEGREAAPTWKEHLKDRSLMNETLSWRSLFILNLVALTLYFVVHIICAGVFLVWSPTWAGSARTSHRTPTPPTSTPASPTPKPSVRMSCVCVWCVCRVSCVSCGSQCVR